MFFTMDKLLIRMFPKLEHPKRNKMFEQKFLAYVLYITLVEIREKAYETDDSRLYYLTDLMHNVPFSLLDNVSAKEEYDSLVRAVDVLKINEWLKAREKEFYQRFPEYTKD